ncbi:MAG: hypothetical protein ACRDOH_04650 [Streptosporangiaceae bacterium]
MTGNRCEDLPCDVVADVVLLAAGLLKDLPQAALGAILVYVATRVFRAGEPRSILRFNRLEFALAVITLLAVAFIGIEQGVVLAALLSPADRTRRSARGCRPGPRARRRSLDSARHQTPGRGRCRA